MCLEAREYIRDGVAGIARVVVAYAHALLSLLIIT